jgi:hypothetical protein
MEDYISKIKKNIWNAKDEDYEAFVAGGFTAALQYYVLLLGIFVILGFAMDVATTGSILDASSIAIFVVIMQPILLAMLAIMSHILLKLLGGPRSFSETIQIYIYGITPSQLFGWIPFVGTFVSLVSLGNVYRGIKAINKLPWWKVAIVAIGPQLIIAAILVMVMLLLESMFYSSMYYY